MASADRYLEYLGQLVMDTTATNSSSLSIAPRDILVIELYCPGISGSFADVGLQFNGDTAGNYGNDYFKQDAANTISVSFSSSATQAIVQGNANTTNGGIATIWVSNQSATPKIGVFTATDRVASTSANETTAWGGFSWHNTTSQITSIVMTGITNTLTAGTSIKVFGRNFD